MARILVIGSSNTDMVVRTPKAPLPGQTVMGGEFMVAAGGKGANQAVAAARAGGLVVFVARVGEDSFGAKAVEGFFGEGIDTRYIIKDPALPSGIAMITVDHKGENCIVVAPGANAALTSEDVNLASCEMASCDVVLLQLETPLSTVQHAVELAKKHDKTVILNPAPAQKLSDDLLSKVTILTPNETETEILTGIRVTDQNSARQAAKALHQKGVETVIITLGEKGAYVSAPGFEEIIPSVAVQAVDTTAAGDVFNGALAVGLAEKRELPHAVRFACKAAAISVTRKGAQPSVPYRREIE